jgi:hypothetical protein
MPNQKQYVIYGLCEPSTNFVRYVGYTSRPVEKRLWFHLNEAKQLTCHRHRWLESLRKKGLKPSIVVLEVVSQDEWQERERDWISWLRVSNDLVNTTEGGEGLVGAPRKVHRQIARKLREGYASGRLNPPSGMTGHSHTEEGRKRIGQGVKNSSRYKRGMRNRKPGQFTPESYDQMRYANRGKKFTEEHKAKIGAKSKGRQATLGTRWIHLGQETKLLLPGHRMPASWSYGRPGTAIAVPGNQFGKALLGRVRSEEHKQHLREALTGNVNIVKSKLGLRKITNGQISKMLKPGAKMPIGWQYSKAA